MKDDEIICYCKNIGRKEIVKAIEHGAKSVGDIKHMTNACTGNQCKELNPKGRCCLVDVIKILEEFGIEDKNENCCNCKGCC